MPCSCPRLPPTKAFCSPRLSSAELTHSAAIPTPFIRASSFHHSHVSSSTPRFSPISLPLSPPHPLLYLTLQFPGVSLPRQNPSPVLADTTCSLSSCVISYAPRTLRKPLPKLEQYPSGMKCPIQGCHSSQQWGCPASSLREKYKQGPLLRKRNAASEVPRAWGMNQQRFYFQCSYKLKHVPFWGDLNVFTLAESA